MVKVSPEAAKVMDAQEALNLVNSLRRGPGHPPLLHLEKCDICKEWFFIQPQDLSRARTHGHPVICRLCAPMHRTNRRKGNKSTP